MEPPSEADETDREESADEVDGVETERTRRGQAPKASDGDTLGDGDEGRSRGEFFVLIGGVMSAMLGLSSCRWTV